MNKKAYGNYGESKASEYLANKCYQILEQNFRCKIGEIDIVAKDKETLVFVEVKTRSNTNYGFPREAVDFRKQQIIGKCALLYLAIKMNKNRNINCRFDVVEIITHKGAIKSINHFENAYQPKVWSV